jgi:hypothetical protein
MIPGQADRVVRPARRHPVATINASTPDKLVEEIGSRSRTRYSAQNDTQSGRL